MNQENNLYNNILSLSRSKLLYTKFNIKDTFENRINLIFLHVSFLFVKVKQDKNTEAYKQFYQKMFDLIFNKIDQNMREIGHGDVTVNKNMKFLVKKFYKILLDCESYKKKSHNLKLLFLNQHLELITSKNDINNAELINYFDKYQAFCFDLTSDSVLKGELKFNLN